MSRTDLLPNCTRTALAKKVARRFIASYFSMGDVVLYGKYKNHRGKIVAFGKDKWGNPTIEIEPIPKGRKKNKEMGLFKIWRADVKEKALAEMNKEAATMDIRKRIATRFVKADGIPVGRSWEHGSVLTHRYRDHFRVTDLTNAGKRGKKVKTMAFGLSTGSTSKQDAWLDEVGKALPNMSDYEQVKNYGRFLKQEDPYVYMDESELRGIDVNPGGTTKIHLTTNKGLEITADPLEFLVKSTVLMRTPKGDGSFKQDTLYSSVSRKDAAPFYNWLKANLSEANKMDIYAMIQTWKDLGVRYNYH